MKHFLSFLLILAAMPSAYAGGKLTKVDFGDRLIYEDAGHFWYTADSIDREELDSYHLCEIDELHGFTDASIDGTGKFCIHHVNGDWAEKFNEELEMALKGEAHKLPENRRSEKVIAQDLLARHKNKCGPSGTVGRDIIGVICAFPKKSCRSGYLEMRDGTGTCVKVENCRTKNSKAFEDAFNGVILPGCFVCDLGGSFDAVRTKTAGILNYRLCKVNRNGQ